MPAYLVVLGLSFIDRFLDGVINPLHRLRVISESHNHSGKHSTCPISATVLWHFQVCTRPDASFKLVFLPLTPCLALAPHQPTEQRRAAPAPATTTTNTSDKKIRWRPARRPRKARPAAAEAPGVYVQVCCFEAQSDCLPHDSLLLWLFRRIGTARRTFAHRLQRSPMIAGSPAPSRSQSGACGCPQRRPRSADCCSRGDPQ